MSAEEDKKQVLAEMDSLMRSLRKCESQATAVAWMARAYEAMNGATRVITNLERMVREEASEQRGLIFHIPTPKLEIVQSIPKSVARHGVRDFAAAQDAKKPNYPHNGQTVVYPEFFLHPGLKPAPRAWTREDTRRLEAAANMGPRRIVKKGR